MENNQERINRLRKRMKQIADIAVDYIPEISGAAAGAAFGQSGCRCRYRNRRQKTVKTFYDSSNQEVEL